MSWNGYSRYVRNKIIKRFENMKNAKDTDTFFAEFPMQKYKEKNSLKIWSKNSKDT